MGGPDPSIPPCGDATAGEWSKTYSLLAPTQDSNLGSRIQNHKRWPLHYHCTVYRFSETTSHVRVSGRILARLLRPLSRCHSNAKETKLVIGWKLLSLGRPNPKISPFLGKWRHAFFENIRTDDSRLSTIYCAIIIIVKGVCIGEPRIHDRDVWINKMLIATIVE